MQSANEKKRKSIVSNLKNFIVNYNVKLLNLTMSAMKNY